jgi:hypothetical protein
MFGCSMRDCGRIALLFKSWQPLYDEILAQFSCLKSVGSSLTEDHVKSQFWREGGGKFSILLVDDFISDFTQSGRNESLNLLLRIVSETAHHSNLLVFVLIQNLGGTGSQRFRSLIRDFSHFFIFSGVDALALRQLASFLLPYRTRFLTSLMELFNCQRGQHLLVDNGFSSPTLRLLCIDTNNEPENAVDSEFTWI